MSLVEWGMRTLHPNANLEYVYDVERFGDDFDGAPESAVRSPLALLRPEDGEFESAKLFKSARFFKKLSRSVGKLELKLK